MVGAAHTTSLYVLLNPGKQALQVHGALDACNLGPFFKKYQRRDGRYIEVRGKGLLGAHLCQPHARSRLRAACTNTGAIILHGPHQDAQKSASRGKSPCCICR